MKEKELRIYKFYTPEEGLHWIVEEKKTFLGFSFWKLYCKINIEDEIKALTIFNQLITVTYSKQELNND